MCVICILIPLAVCEFRVLREQWIRAKYERQEFMDIEKQTYLAGMKEGFLWKKGKDDSKFQSRKFILSEADNCIKYFRNVDVSRKTIKNTIGQGSSVGHV